MRRAGSVSPLILREPHNQRIDIPHSPKQDFHFLRGQQNGPCPWLRFVDDQHRNSESPSAKPRKPANSAEIRVRSHLDKKTENPVKLRNLSERLSFFLSLSDCSVSRQDSAYRLSHSARRPDHVRTSVAFFLYRRDFNFTRRMPGRWGRAKIVEPVRARREKERYR